MVLAARSGSSTHTAMQLAQLACHIYRFLLATRLMHQSSNIKLQHSPGCAGCPYWQRHSHVDTAIIGLQHSSSCAGCSHSQQHSHANAASTARLSILSISTPARSTQPAHLHRVTWPESISVRCFVADCLRLFCYTCSFQLATVYAGSQAR